MKTKKLPILFATSAALLGSNLAEAQFKKFKSKTNFTPPQSGNAPESAVKVTPANESAPGQARSASESARKKIGGSNQNIFGRSTITGSSTAKDPKFVNLNPETAFGPEIVTSFDFQNISLVDLTKHMQKLTGINLILDKDLKGKISIMAPSAITVGDAWRAYLTALNINGYTLVKSGTFYQIVQARDIRYTPTKIYTGAYTPDTENYVMRIIPLKNIDSTEVTRSFRPFMSRYGRIIDIKQTNTIIVQDTGSNIQRLLRLIKFIDVPGHEVALQIIPVKNSSAQEIAKLLDKILKQKTGSRSKSRSSKSGTGSSENISKIIAEPRTNSIIAMANAQGAEQLRKLIDKLDVRLVSGQGNQIHVYYLNYGDAKKLASTLTSLVSGAAPTNSKSRRPTSRLSSSSQDDSATLFNDKVKVTADEDNNALVVTASPTDYLTLKSVIKKLDIPRDQVYVEGMIMETNVSKTTGWGVSYLGAYGAGSAQKAGFNGGQADLVGLLTNNITNLGGLFVGAGVGNDVELNVGGETLTVNTINALISAIARDTATNVLATPQILALDNEEAEFEVGETVPTTEATNAANGSTQISTKQQKVALNLKIKPQINKVTRFIKLNITQKIDDFSNRVLNSGSQASGVGTTTRTAKTTVVVRDQDTIAMGGLMRDRESTQVSKVPLLGDIPILGWLFKNKSREKQKINLLFFLTPRILAPYEKTASATTKDVINRRVLHLKDTIGDDDSFSGTMKGLFEKVDKQSEGPLFDPTSTDRYKDQYDRNNPDQSRVVPGGVPNYQDIVQTVKQSAAGVEKKKVTPKTKKKK
ncbi:MAG: type II secretion system secretin GspD [Bacteriovoracaceae bacterium]